MIFWSLNLVSKHESNNIKSRSRLEIREWSYDNLDLVSPGESKKNNSQSRQEKKQKDVWTIKMIIFLILKQNSTKSMDKVQLSSRDFLDSRLDG